MTSRPTASSGPRPDPPPEPGLDVKWGGSELYPTIDELRAGKSSESSVVLAVKATEAASETAMQKELEPGQTQLKIRYDATAGPAPLLSSIQTPDGNFTNLVGIRTRMGSSEVVNANPADSAKLATLLTSFGKALSGTALYFARGVGMVASTGLFGDSKLERCSG